MLLSENESASRTCVGVILPRRTLGVSSLGVCDPLSLLYHFLELPLLQSTRRPESSNPFLSVLTELLRCTIVLVVLVIQIEQICLRIFPTIMLTLMLVLAMWLVLMLYLLQVLLVVVLMFNCCWCSLGVVLGVGCFDVRVGV